MRSVVGDYLEAIYTLNAEGDDAFDSTLAGLFGVSRQAASKTVDRLTRDGFVAPDGRRLTLTSAGVARAEEGLSRHCVTERFLVDVLGIDWSAVHEQARTFERGLTPLLAERIDERVGYPSTCPHGNAVPRPSQSAATYLKDNNAVSLLDTPLGLPAQVLAISETAEQSAEWLRQCDAAGVRPGAPVVVRSRTGRDVQLETAGRSEPVTMESALAAHVWVVTAPTQEER